MATLPRSYSKGAKKAFANFVSLYGADGRRIFAEKAIEQGRGDSLRQIVDSVYAKGAKLPRRSKRR